MAITWGFGIEKETAFVGYDKPLKNFTHDSSSVSSGWSHHESQMTELGDFARETYDSTVVGGHELISVKKQLKGLPKNTILGFIKDTEKRAREKVRGSREYKRTIPYGTIPGLTKEDLGSIVPGSYHFNVTFPYNDERMNPEIYEKKLKKGLLNVRVIQPLIIALLGSVDMDGIGKPKVLEGSYRQAYSNNCSSVAFAKLDESNSSVFKAITHKINNPSYESPNDGELPGYGRQPGSNQIKWRQAIGDVPQFASGNNFYTDFRIKAFRQELIPTIEYRFLDTFDTRGTYGILGVISLAMANAKRTIKFSDPNEDTNWVNGMAEIIKEGWNSFVDKTYVKYIEDKMKIKLNVNTSKIRADLLFQKVIDELWKHNKNDLWVKHWFNEKPEVHNFNKDSWEFYFVKKFNDDELVSSNGNKDLKFKKKMINFLKILGNINTTKSSGWVKVNYKGNNYGVRDIILDEEVLGSEYGFEDTEDILHLFDRYEILKLKEDKSGRIVDVKKNFSSEDELNEKLKELFNEENMLNGDDGLIKSEEVANFIPIETAPEPITRERTPVNNQVVSGNITINPQTVTEEQRYYADDFEAVIYESNLLFNNRRLSMRIKFAVMTDSNGDWFNRPFWKGKDLYVPLTFAEFEQPSLWINELKRLKMWTFDRRSNSVIAKVPYDGYEDDFYSKLENQAVQEYGKNTSENITTDRAGIMKLREKGIVIVSYRRGKYYNLIKTKDVRSLGVEFKVIKYIPYHRGYSIKKQGNKFTLFINKKPVSVIGGQ